MTGKLILIIGPSGSGKSSLIAHIRATYPDFVFPTSCTTREPRPGEKDGDVYYFLSDEEFDARIKDGDFLEWASYGGNRYGTLKSEILTPVKEGKIVVREIEVQGAQSLLSLLPRENLAIIFIDAGSWDALQKRIEKRAPLSAKELILRKERYDAERAFLPQADYIVVNADNGLHEAKKSMDEALMAIVENAGSDISN